MNNQGQPSQLSGPEEQEYASLIELEELESLLEDLEEQGLTYTPIDHLPHDLQARFSQFGLSDVDHLRAKIKHLHRNLDQHDDS